MKKLFYALCWVACILFFFGCKSPKQTESDVFFEWKDSYNRHIELVKAPERIVSISPAITEVMYLVGAQNKLVGISDFCMYPPATAKIAKIGGMHNINFEILLSLHPDVVLIGSMISQKDVDAIEKMGIPVVCIVEETSMEGMADMIRIIGKITNHEEKAEEQAEKWLTNIQNIRQENAQDSTTKKKVYYVVGFGDAGDFTAPKNTHINEIIELAGCENVGKKLSTWNISREVLFEANPDIILIRKEDKEAFCNQYPYTLLPAVKENRVYPIESGWIDIVSPRNIKAVDMIRKIKKDFATGE